MENKKAPTQNKTPQQTINDAELIQSKLDELEVWNEITNVIKWGRLYGGAIAVMLIDGQDVSTPLNIDSVPAVGVDWVAFGIRTQRPDDGPYFEQHDENATSIRHEVIDVALSFYGNRGQHFAKLFVDSTAIPQNVNQLKPHKIKFVGVGEVLTAPDLINEQYVHRFDVNATFRRKTERTYAIQSFLGLPEIKNNRN